MSENKNVIRSHSDVEIYDNWMYIFVFLLNIQTSQLAEIIFWLHHHCIAIVYFLICWCILFVILFNYFCFFMFLLFFLFFLLLLLLYSHVMKCNLINDCIFHLWLWFRWQHYPQRKWEKERKNEREREKLALIKEDWVVSF